MTLDLFIALTGYSFVTSVTPGPNNFMLLSSGTNYGFVKTIPHMLGISTGFFVMLMAVGFGLGGLLLAFPQIHLFMKIVGGSYLLYLAWKIAISRSMSSDGKVTGKPMTFMGAAAFQWVNPKAWVMALTAMAIYTNNVEHPFFSVIFVSVVFAAINLPSVSVWAAFGVALRRFLSDPERLKWFNISMGILLALTLWPLLE